MNTKKQAAAHQSRRDPNGGQNDKAPARKTKTKYKKRDVVIVPAQPNYSTPSMQNDTKSTAIVIGVIVVVLAAALYFIFN